VINIRKILKRNIFARYLYENIITYRKKNIFKTKTNKRALLSYSTLPFKDKNKLYIHPNFIEDYFLAEILNEYGYIVDVFNNTFNGKINYDQYDIVIGEGLPISNYFLKMKMNVDLLTIYYATGSHPIYNNIQSYKSLFDFFKKHKQYIFESSRIVNFKYAIGASLSEYLILLGNNHTRITFEEYRTARDKIYNLNAPYYACNIITDFSRKDIKKFLWFGSYGLIHKDLHSIIDIFKRLNNLELHICGYIDGEQNFSKVYANILNNSTNIHLHGFININTNEFKHLMEDCSFVILSSYAEGCATSIITAMGNGGLIPLISKQCGIDIVNGLIFDNHDEYYIENAIINIVNSYTKNMIIEFSKKNIRYIKEYFSVEMYKCNLRNILDNIIKGSK